MLCLRIEAAFAAFRTFTAGVYRPTAPFLTPSAAYGLLLNVAGIDSREDDGKSPMTLMRSNLPRAEIALGPINFPAVHTLYQQLHNYPVGITGKERAVECKGTKYNIQPVRREFLSGIQGYVCMRGNDSLESQVRSGLAGAGRPDGIPRYGIPFLGDNSFMVDVLREEAPPRQLAYWYRSMARLEPGKAGRHVRLTAWIDRADQTRTVARLYEPAEKPSSGPPEDEAAWTVVEPPAEVTMSSTERPRKRGRMNG